MTYGPGQGADLPSIESIKQLKARYLRLVDAKRWPDLRALFSADATFDGLWTTVVGPDDFVAKVSGLLAPMTSLHRATVVEITLLSATSATGVWDMSDRIEWPRGTASHHGPTRPGQRGIKGCGRYEESYRCEPDSTRWVISSLRLVRTRIDPLM